MDIVAAGGFAPDNLFGFGSESGEADGAVAFNGFAVGGALGVGVCGGSLGGGGEGGEGEDFAEFLGAVIS